jgi:hypothetical protein
MKQENLRGYRAFDFILDSPTIHGIAEKQCSGAYHRSGDGTHETRHFNCSPRRREGDILMMSRDPILMRLGKDGSFATSIERPTVCKAAGLPDLLKAMFLRSLRASLSKRRSADNNLGHGQPGRSIFARFRHAPSGLSAAGIESPRYCQYHAQSISSLRYRRARR